MADVAAQKREARRRRILENSENRLKKITGLYSNDGIIDSTNGSKRCNDDPSLGSIEDKKLSPPLRSTADNPSDKELDNMEQNLDRIVAQMNTVETSVIPKCRNNESSPTSSEFVSVSVSETNSSLIYNFCQKARIHLIALAVIVRILLTSPFAVLCGESAVLPLFTIESAEWIYAKLHPMECDDSPSGLLGMAMMMSGIAPQKVSFLLKIWNTFNQVSVDFSIYFFVFSLTHVLLELFSSSEINGIIKSMPNYFYLLFAALKVLPSIDSTALSVRFVILCETFSFVIELF